MPLHLRGIVGTSEKLLSLGTDDRRATNLLAPSVVARQFAEWSAASGAEVSGGDTTYDSLSIAVQVAYDDMLAAMELRRRDWPDDAAGYADKLAQREVALQTMTRQFQNGDLSRWAPVAANIIDARKLPLKVGTDEHSEFLRSVARANLEAVAVFIRRTKGDLEAGPKSELVRETKSKSMAKAALGEMLLELFELWAEEMLAKGAKRMDTVTQDRKVIAQFSTFVGVDRDVRSITPIEVADYRDTLRSLPPKSMSKRELRGLDMRSAARKARELGLSQTAFTNINKHLSTISPLFKHLARQPKWAGLQNPCSGLFYQKVKGKNARPPFTTEDLNKILKSPLFTGFKADGEEHVPGAVKARDWRYWIPLVAMFTGARVGEIAQLRLSDVVKERGVWFIHIRHDTAKGLATKSGKSRPAAVHPLLQQMGFLTYHQEMSEQYSGQQDAALFPEVVPNERGQISGKPSRWWREYLMAIGVKDPIVEGGEGGRATCHRQVIYRWSQSTAEC